MTMLYFSHYFLAGNSVKMHISPFRENNPTMCDSGSPFFCSIQLNLSFDVASSIQLESKSKKIYLPLSSPPPYHILHPIATSETKRNSPTKIRPCKNSFALLTFSARAEMAQPFAWFGAASTKVSGFYFLSDDLVLKIFLKLEQDPRDWSRLACVCARFSSLIRNTCWKAKCYLCVPSVVSALLAARFGDGARDEPPGGWGALYKLSVCCPGLLHSGLLLENSDFGLAREIGPDENYRLEESPRIPSPLPATDLASSADSSISTLACAIANEADTQDCGWSLFDDLYTDTMYDISESSHHQYPIEEHAPASVVADIPTAVAQMEVSNSSCRLPKEACTGVHLATDPWILIREQGSKLLAPRFRGDTLYISGRPGCVHGGSAGGGRGERPREYILFRGVFVDFKRSGVWRTILTGGGDGTRRGRVDVNCAFCPCRETWDLQSSFCLARVASGYHDDGEPVVRAFVCENGHVAGAWTELPNSS